MDSSDCLSALDSKVSLPPPPPRRPFSFAPGMQRVSHVHLLSAAKGANVVVVQQKAKMPMDACMRDLSSRLMLISLSLSLCLSLCLSVSLSVCLSVCLSLTHALHSLLFPRNPSTLPNQSQSKTNQRKTVTRKRKRKRKRR